MSKKVLAVIGAGHSGRIIARTAVDMYPELDVYLIGPESQGQEGLFYVNEKIPGIAEKPIKVEYGFIKPMYLSDLDAKESYIRKTRGDCFNPFQVDVKSIISSIDKVGTKEVGYTFNEDLDFYKDISYINRNCTDIYLKQRSISVEDFWRPIRYDYLIVTTPYFITAKLIRDFGKLSVKGCDCSPIYVSSGIKDKEGFSPTFNKIRVTYDCDPQSHIYRRNEYVSDSDPDFHVSWNVLEAMSLPKFDDKREYSEVKLGKIKNPGKRPKVLIEELNQKEFDLIDLEEKCPIKFLGRFARWDYHYLVTDSYKDGMNFLNKNLLI